jgi:lipopolysaccharide/colanic/teichoic acid biosynthesis glycosyltransferase
MRDITTASTQGLGWTIKRILDVSIASVCLVLLSPVMLIIAIWIKYDSAGPAIYRHLRVGKNGKPFWMYKFRSMTTGGEDKGYMEYLRQLIESEQNGDGIPYNKMSNDPRITRVGGILRKYYLDELPQFWNIVKGEMSLVGPRPHVQFEVEHYTPEQRSRLIVRPGATGLWQVVGKADCTFSELIDLDLEYIENWSPGLDNKIMLQTVMLMVQGGEGFWARMSKRIPGRTRTRSRNRETRIQAAATIDSQPLVTQDDEI